MIDHTKLINTSLSNVKQSCNTYISHIPTDFSLSHFQSQNQNNSALVNPHYLSVDRFILEERVKLKANMRVSKSLSKMIESDRVTPDLIAPYYQSDK